VSDVLVLASPRGYLVSRQSMGLVRWMEVPGLWLSLAYERNGLPSL